MQTTSTWTLNNDRKKMGMIQHEYILLRIFWKNSKFEKIDFSYFIIELSHLQLKEVQIIEQYFESIE